MMADVLSRANSNSILRTLFATDASGVILPIGNHLDALYASEREIIHNVGSKRQHEFSTGRFCAKTALAQLDIENFPVLRNEHREPLWPSGYVGSISHCKDLCGAVAARKSDFKSIGFDIENIKPLKQDIAKAICTEQETKWLAQQNAHSHDVLVILLFSLKESVFKCIFPYQNIRPGFKDCSITPDFGTNRATTIFQRQDILPNIKTSFCITGRHIYSGAYYR